MEPTPVTACLPLPLFYELGRLGSVTEAESRAYAWLLKNHWLRQKINHDKSSYGNEYQYNQRLEASFDRAGQLNIDWTGDPGSSRRLIMVAHVDCEGYVLVRDDIDWDAEDLMVSGRHATALRIEKFRVGAMVDVVAGRGLDCHHFKGKIVRVNQTLKGVVADGVAVVHVYCMNEAEKGIFQSFLLQEYGTVTAMHSFETIDSIKDHNLVASYIDNAAGVAVATAVLTDLATSGAVVNASVLYTRGEESGFSGLIDLIAKDGVPISENLGELLWVVVDSSEVRRSRRFPVDDWPPVTLNFENGLPVTSDDVRRCFNSCAAVRLGDSTSFFDPAVGRLLYQAAIEARNSLSEEWLARSGLHTHSLSAQLQTDVEARMMGVSGLFYGGECEATILCHLFDLLSAFGNIPAGTAPLVGSIAIPITNYRAIEESVAIALGGYGHHQPEHTRVGALNSAFLILRSACQLHVNYFFPQGAVSSGVGFRRNPGYEGGPRTREEFIEEWLSLKRNEPSGCGAATRRWIQEEGVALAKQMNLQFRL